MAKLVPCVSFGNDAVGQTFRKKPTVGFLSNFENEFMHRRKLKCMREICYLFGFWVRRDNSHIRRFCIYEVIGLDP